MLNLYVKLRNLVDREEGQGMVEYSLIIGLVAIGVITILGGMGTKIGEAFTAITNNLKTTP